MLVGYSQLDGELLGETPERTCLSYRLNGMTSDSGEMERLVGQVVFPLEMALRF